MMAETLIKSADRLVYTGPIQGADKHDIEFTAFP